MTINIPNGLTEIKLSGDRAFNLDLIEAHQKIMAINRDCKEKNLNNFEYVESFMAWIKEKAGVELIRAEADYLIDRIICVVDAEKKTVANSLRSPNSTDHPSDSLPQASA